jgi:flagellar protein FliS
MTEAAAYASYRQTQLGTASQARLIVMLHDGAIRFLQQAIAAMDKKDYYGKSVNLNKALAIIVHLWASVNEGEGNEIGANLIRIFQYMHTRLLQANVDNDPAPMQEAIAHLRTFREAWNKVDRLNSASALESSDAKPSLTLSRAV